MRKYLLAGLAAAALAGAASLTACTSGETTKAAAVIAKPGAGGSIVASRRVNESQYRNIVADTFGSDIQLAGRFEPELRQHLLLAIGAGKLSISNGGFEQYYALAKSISDQALNDKRRDKFATCKPANIKGPDDACAAAFVREQGRKLFRRPLTDAEVAERVTLARMGAESSGNYYDGLKLALTNMLTSAPFLFRMEMAETDPANRKGKRLDGYSKASRLSFMLWNTTPDEELLKAAEAGDLHTQAGLDKQLVRMMASPRLEAGTRAFFADVLQLEAFDTTTKDAGVYPKYSQAVADSAREQTLRTVVSLLLTKKGDYRDVFTAPDTYIDRTLASVYRLPYLGKEGGTWRPYRYPDSADQAGLLTQVTFMSLFSHPGRSSPTKRGVALNEIFMCQETPPPPDNVDFTLLQNTENPLLKTVRARLEAHANEPSCAACHNMVDPIGLSLERFDSIGQPRMRENGELIDVSAELDGAKFTGARGLGKVLHDNPKIPACLVRNVYAYGVGRDPSSTWERAYLDTQIKGFAESGYVVPTLMARIASSPEFFRVAPPEAAPLKQTKATVAAAQPAKSGKEKS